MLALSAWMPRTLLADNDRAALASAEQDYQAALAKIEAERQALQVQYLHSLEAILSQAMDDKDLDAAIEIRDEINRVRPDVAVTAEDLKRGLILYFDFDHPQPDGKVPDLSGHGNDGAAVGVEWTPDGKHGGAARFGATGSYITVSNNGSLNPPEFTMAAWIKTSFKDTIWRRIFDKETGVGYVMSMCGDYKAKSYEGQVDIEGGKGYVASGVQVADGQWHQVVGVCTGDQLLLYVDGKRVGRPSKKVDVLSNAFDLTIGANRSNPEPSEVNASFNGTMDDVMMFNRAMTAREVAALFAAQR
ncbi:MAG TPA: LamG domain-containing protein [Tepidisphaeraceae bacterium]|nr:LamG domain-containing protein [Tepidisphaeraceae bacterium]